MPIAATAVWTRRLGCWIPARLCRACRKWAAAVAGLAGWLALGAAIAAPGDLDACFGIAGRVQLQLDTSGNNKLYPMLDEMALAQQGDGKIIVAAAVQDYSGTGGSSVDLLVARLNANGSFDTGFNGKGWTAIDLRGTGGDDYATAVLVQPDGKIVAAGQSTVFTPVQGANVALARVNADGTLDASFTPSANNTVISTAVQADGKIVIGGQFTSVNGPAADLFHRPERQYQVQAARRGLRGNAPQACAEHAVAGPCDRSSLASGYRFDPQDPP